VFNKFESGFLPGVNAGTFIRIFMGRVRSTMNMKRVAGIFLFFILLGSLVQAKELKRADYRITIPVKSTVDAEDPDIDLDHYTTINFPDKNFLLILVIDDKGATEEAYQHIVKGQQKALKNCKSSKSFFLKEIKGSGVQLNGRINGMKYTYQVGYLKGRKKGFVFNAGYLDSESESALRYLKTTINSFKEL